MKNKLVVLLLSLIFLLATFTASLSAATDLIYLGNSTISNVTINDFNANVTSGFAPLNVQFTSEVTGNVTNYLWIIETPFKNYYSKHPMTANYTFVTPGVYAASLIVSGAEGHASLTKENYITVTAPISKANFTATHNLKSPLTVHFRGSVSEGTALRYIWYFGDGKMVKGKNVIHVYHKQGIYPVSVMVYLNNGTTIKETKCLILTK
jgi:large repetitive protein